MTLYGHPGPDTPPPDEKLRTIRVLPPSLDPADLRAGQVRVEFNRRFDWWEEQVISSLDDLAWDSDKSVVLDVDLDGSDALGTIQQLGRLIEFSARESRFEQIGRVKPLARKINEINAVLAMPDE